MLLVTTSYYYILLYFTATRVLLKFSYYSTYFLDVNPARSSVMFTSTGDLTGTSVTNEIVGGPFQNIPVNVIAGNIKGTVSSVSIYIVRFSVDNIILNSKCILFTGTVITL